MMNNLDDNSNKTNSRHEYTTQIGWNERYYKKGALGGAGTFAHSPAGNRQFFKIKFKAIDRCLKLLSTNLNGKAILDAAGGSGQFIDYFLERGGELSHLVIADFSQVALDYVDRHYKEEQRIETVLFDLKQRESKWSEKYDFVFVMEAIFLLETDEELAQAIKNLALALKPGGYLIISDIFPPDSIRDAEYVVRRSKALFEKLMDQNRLSVVGYVPQTFLFNRNFLGRAQFFIERVAGSLLYWLDIMAINLGWRPPANSPSDIKYLIAKKEVDKKK